MRGSIFVLPRNRLNMFVSDWHYHWFSCKYKVKSTTVLSCSSVVAAKRTGPMLHRSGIYGVIAQTSWSEVLRRWQEVEV